MCTKDLMMHDPVFCWTVLAAANNCCDLVENHLPILEVRKNFLSDVHCSKVLESLDPWTDPAVADGKALQLDDGKIVLDA
jgi:hypothetical protein